ncbi:ATP-dependent helicase ULS1-like [Aphis craccivora]|uniref:ATP-dependent helicase ULS1-like n=1 Tax=Aphis craccivora TaxID=307492 RepID=A0A6G0ZD49_APHCR|nr:ATP-dependent helicase ULS1-like [Aphis craccivora]
MELGIFDSERSDKCIDLTMMCVFFSNFGGGFRWKSEYPWCIIKVKMTEKREFLRKTSFRLDRFFYMTTKIFNFSENFFLNHSKYLKIEYKVPNKIHMHNFFLLAFELLDFLQQFFLIKTLMLRCTKNELKETSSFALPEKNVHAIKVHFSLFATYLHEKAARKALKEKVDRSYYQRDLLFLTITVYFI